MTKRKKDSGGTIGVILAIGAIGTIGTVALVRSKSTDKSASTKSSSSGTSQSAASLVDVAKTIREATLIVDGCTVAWRVGEGSRTELLGHHTDFFVPAIAEARAKGKRTVDEVTCYVAALLVPGCMWPPAALFAFDIDKAINNELTFVQQQAWTIVQTSGAVRLYLTIRQVVATLETQTRRG